MTAPTHTRHAPVAPAHRDPNVLRWLGAYTTSVTGDVIYFTALTWAVAEAAGPAQGRARARRGRRATRPPSCSAAVCSPTGSDRAGSSSAATSCAV
ncbi:hypothetical protein [Streptomyces sp. KL116D]|uniref:hypothetical protein n=1 Tax=Streptomyces sp. KL116D TaxID=3045152 RepID=UPI003556D910